MRASPGNANPAGMTPITLRLIPSTVMAFPRMFGSAAKRLRQSPSLSRATPGEPGSSSWEAKVLPIAGLTRRTGKKLDVTIAAGKRTASPAPVKVTWSR